MTDSKDARDMEEQRALAECGRKALERSSEDDLEDYEYFRKQLFKPLKFPKV